MENLQVGGVNDYINVSRGLVPGASRLQKVGYNPAVSTSDVTVWSETASVSYPTVASTVKVSCGSSSDTSAGTGARTMRISGLDSFFNPISEVITLNGQTPVISTLSYYRIIFLQVLTAGSGDTNVGTIYVGTGSVSSGIPSTIYNTIGPSFNRSLSAFTTIPAGSTGYLLDIGYGSTALDSTTMKFLLRANGGVWQTARILIGLGGQLDSKLPVAIAAGTDMEVRASTVTDPAIVTAEMELLILQPN